ncbi:MAG: hypothetical protein JO022_21725 [Acidobacteriaceae bacterium]|nr:hypothetical protein [Acidobacteriaceae bacterium]
MRAFCALRDLPAIVDGPVDFCAFAVLAVAWALVAIGVVAPELGFGCEVSLA